jgi:hypothetical protein
MKDKNYILALNITFHITSFSNKHSYFIDDIRKDGCPHSSWKFRLKPWEKNK